MPANLLTAFWRCEFTELGHFLQEPLMTKQRQKAFHEETPDHLSFVVAATNSWNPAAFLLLPSLCSLFHKEPQLWGRSPAQPTSACTVRSHHACQTKGLGMAHTALQPLHYLLLQDCVHRYLNTWYLQWSLFPCSDCSWGWEECWSAVSPRHCWPVAETRKWQQRWGLSFKIIGFKLQHRLLLCLIRPEINCITSKVRLS